jgi:hypothetical protein
MISIVLLVMISIAIYQATTQTYRYRAKIINEGDFYASIRLAMGLMDRDIAALFSPVNMNPNTFKKDTGTAAADQDAEGGFAGPKTPSKPDPAAAENQQKLDEITRSELGKTTDYWLGATDVTAIRPSRFVGTENRISFVTASHQRLYKDTPESEYSKVVYELRDDKESSELGIQGAKLLVRIEDANVFDDDKSMKNDKNARLYPLLPGVQVFKFRYYRKDKQAWERAWDTERDDMKGLYPDLIEVTIEVAGISKLAFKGSYMFKPETPFYGLDPTL